MNTVYSSTRFLFSPIPNLGLGEANIRMGSHWYSSLSAWGVDRDVDRARVRPTMAVGDGVVE
jgi:hypothetical protein